MTSVYSENINKKSERTYYLNKKIDEYRNKKIDESYFRYGFTEPWSKMIRSSVILDNNITFEETQVANDYLFSVMLGFYAHKIIIDNNTIYVVTESDNSLSKKTQTTEQIIVRIKVYARINQFFHKKNIALKERFLVPALWNLFRNNAVLYLKTIIYLFRTDKRFWVLPFVSMMYGVNNQKKKLLK